MRVETVEIVGTHPYADKFPMLSDTELDDLAESIRMIGLLHPVVVDRDGLVLDGRNRVEAANRAQVEVRTVVYEGDDIAEYVIACNVTRRNMSTGARAMATALVLEADGRRDNGRWRRGSVLVGNQESLITGQWQNILGQCGVILDYKPDLAHQVVTDELALDAAFKQAEAIRTSAERDKILKREKAKREKAEAAAEAQRNAEIIADLTQAGAQNYLDLIDAGTMTTKAAWAAHREDTRRQREREALERRGRSDLYSGIAKGLMTIGTYGGYEDIPKLMSEFDPAELDPPMLDRYYEIAWAERAQRFIVEFIEWRKNAS